MSSQNKFTPDELVFLLQMLQNATLLDELHAFLWTDAITTRSITDMGWSCRDHAVVLGQLLADSGRRVAVRHGKCMFVQGPTADGTPPVGLGQEPDDGHAVGHTWLYVAGFGDVDLSPNLASSHPPWRPVKSPGVIGSTWIADRATRFIVTRTLNEYAEAVARATYEVAEFRAIYFVRRAEPFTFEAAQAGLTSANSVMSLRLLKNGLPDDLYVRLATHLQGVVSGKRRSLRRLSRNKAWSSLASDPQLNRAAIGQDANHEIDGHASVNRSGASGSRSQS